jgi:ribosome modulation factor
MNTEVKQLTNPVQAFRYGAYASQDNKSRNDNPYQEQTQEHTHWLDGWLEANHRKVAANTKESILDTILTNSVYTPESGLIQQLRHTMSKLSKSDLSNLGLIIQIKMDDAAEALEDSEQQLQYLLHHHPWISSLFKRD